MTDSSERTSRPRGVAGPAGRKNTSARSGAKGMPRQDRSTERKGPRREILTADVLDKAAALFTERGFAATSLQDVADQVGLTRTAIYHYFDSKDALLQELVRGVTRQATQIFDDLAAAPDMRPADKVREAARRLVLWVTSPATHFKLVDRSEHELSAATANVHRQAKRRVLNGMSRLIDEGIAAGEFRAVEPGVAALAIIGMCNWVAWWFNPAREKSAGDIAEMVAELAVASLRRPDWRADPTDLGSLTRNIRAELDVIDRLHTRRDQR